MAAPMLRLIADHAHVALLVAPGGIRPAAWRTVHRILVEGGVTVARSGSALPADRRHVMVLVGDGPAEERVDWLRAVEPAGACAAIVIVLPSDAGPRPMRRALQAGADAIVLEAELQETLLDAVRAGAAGQLYVPRSLRPVLAPPSLTHRERQVLALVADGMTNRQIGANLFLAESTVKTHLASVFSKLGVASRAEATMKVRDPEVAGPLGLAGFVALAVS
jgi:DNA-binding NarL/FixJ family response regulator